MEEILLKKGSGWTTTIGVVILAVIFIGIILVVDSGRTHSTKGVVTVSDYEAVISKGDTLALTSGSGKSITYWLVTYDGKRTVTAKQDASFFPSEHSVSVCGIGCSQELTTGILSHITIVEQTDSRVSVQWPWGWGYLRYQQ